MKKYLVANILALISSGIIAQTTFQATLQPVASSPAVSVFVKTSSTKLGKPSGITLTIAIPVSVGARPPLSVTFANPNISLIAPVYNAINQDIGGVLHYIYNILGEGIVTAAAPNVNYVAGIDVLMATITFSGDPSLSSQIKLANLPEGGIDPNPNSFFGFSIDGADVVNVVAQFYAIPGISTVVNDGFGYSGTSYALTTGLVPLPVKFTGFNVVKKSNDGLVTWQVESETSVTDRYEVERSLNGVDFQKVYTVAPKNNGSSSNSYELTDINLSTVRSSGIIYYRIKQTDKDGKFVYTGIKSLRLNAKSMAVGVYPNPIRNFANLSIDLEQDSNATITINDASGKQVQNIQMPLFKGPNIKKINMGALASGSYILKIQTATETETISVVKTN